MLRLASILFATLCGFPAYASGFHALAAKTARGEPFDFDKLAGKVVVVANTASKCGYTYQFRELQAVQDTYGELGVVVLGMPSNSFAQEDLDAREAANFCELNYGVKFTILEKAPVTGAQAHPLFKHLTANAPESGEVTWNFEKFVVDRKGQVVARFPPNVSPKSAAFKAALDKAVSSPSEARR